MPKYVLKHSALKLNASTLIPAGQVFEAAASDVQDVPGIELVAEKAVEPAPVPTSKPKGK